MDAATSIQPLISGFIWMQQATACLSYGCSNHHHAVGSCVLSTLFTVNGHCYEAVTAIHSWRVAESYCVHNGGHLAYISSKGQQDAIYQVVKDHIGQNVWIGLNDLDNEGSYRWISDSVAVTTLSATIQTTPETTRLATTIPAIVTYGCTTVYPNYGYTEAGTLFTINNTCYELNANLHTWRTANSMCNIKGGSLAYIDNRLVQDAMYNVLKSNFNKNVWIGLNDLQYEGYFSWVSGESIFFENFFTIFILANFMRNKNLDLSIAVEDCRKKHNISNFYVSFIRKKLFTKVKADLNSARLFGQLYIDARPFPGNTPVHVCTRKSKYELEWKPIGEKLSYTLWHNGYVGYNDGEDCVVMMASTPEGGHLKYQTTSTTRPTTAIPDIPIGSMFSDGSTRLCPSSVRSFSDQYRTVLAQHGHSCYELLNTGVTWSYAETLCENGGGHLVQISGQQEETYIQQFLLRHGSPDVWIGLNDRQSEGHMHWTSGEPVNYLHWIRGHEDNIVGRYDEDCVVMFPQRGGHWDDVPCGWQNGMVEKHVGICEY
ncbi:LECE-like protein, partial [Mya arenaria]